MWDTFPTWTSRQCLLPSPSWIINKLFLSRFTICLLCSETVLRMVKIMVNQIRCVPDLMMLVWWGRADRYALLCLEVLHVLLIQEKFVTGKVLNNLYAIWMGDRKHKIPSNLLDIHLKCKCNMILPLFLIAEII